MAVCTSDTPMALADMEYTAGTPGVFQKLHCAAHLSDDGLTINMPGLMCHLPKSHYLQFRNFKTGAVSNTICYQPN